MLVALDVALISYVVQDSSRGLPRNTGIALEQIALAARIHFTEDPNCMFVSFDELVVRYPQIGRLQALAGENYRGLFPLRVDFTELAVKLGDGRDASIWLPSDRSIAGG